MEAYVFLAAASLQEESEGEGHHDLDQYSHCEKFYDPAVVLFGLIDSDAGTNGQQGTRKPNNDDTDSSDVPNYIWFIATSAVQT